MTAITQRLRLVLRPHPYTFHHYCSSNSVPPSDIPPPKSEPESVSKPLFSSYFNDVRANLQRQSSSQNRPQPFRKPPPPSNSASLEQIQRNLAEFRRRTAPPPPSSVSGQYVSFQELRKSNVFTRYDESENFSSNSAVKPPAGRSFDGIKESLVNLRSNLKNQSDQMSPSRLRESLESSRIIGESSDLPSFLLKENNSSVGSKSAMSTTLMRMYNYSDLGTKLKMLRPEKKKGKWFSLQELNERLAKLRKLEEKESEGRLPGVSFRDVRYTIEQLAHAEKEMKMNKTMQRLDILNKLGGTPSYLLSEPQDHLVEKYFHPDNMSSAERLKLELKKVRDEFKMSESDCGSARVQVAQLTTKIKYLSTVLQKKDKHSRRGLVAMVQRRKKLLKYLRRTDWDSYCLVLSKLGLRDTSDVKA